MRNSRVRVAAGAIGCVLWAAAGQAADLTSYGEFRLGSSVAVVSTAIGAERSDIKVVHQRPAVIQELMWRPKGDLRAPAADPGHAERILFRFYNGELFQLIVDFDLGHTRALSAPEVISMIAGDYGPAATRSVPRTSQSPTALDQGRGTPLAAWGDEKNSLLLYESAHVRAFTLVVTDERLAALARAAAAQARVLEVRDTSSRRAAEEKARQADKPAPPR